MYMKSPEVYLHGAASDYRDMARYLQFRCLRNELLEELCCDLQDCPESSHHARIELTMLHGWQMDNLEVLISMVSLPAQVIVNKILPSLLKIYKTYHLTSRIRALKDSQAFSALHKALIEYPSILEKIKLQDYSLKVKDLFKQLAHCQIIVWNIEKTRARGVESLFDIRSMISEAIIKMRHMIEQTIDRFAYTCVFWPNRVFPSEKLGPIFKSSPSTLNTALEKCKLIGNKDGININIVYKAIQSLCERKIDPSVMNLTCNGESLWSIICSLSNSMKTR